MAITVADNFSYQGKKPLDGRDTFATLAAMKAYAEASVYDGCLSYCDEDGKRYEFKSTNTVDPTTGKWREYSSGGGGETYSDFTGATASTAGAHGLVPAPSAGDEGKVLFGNGLWGALPSVDLSVLSNEAFIFSTDEKPVGMWKDGRILYQRSYTCNHNLTANSWLAVSEISSVGILQIAKAFVIRDKDDNGLYMPVEAAPTGSNNKVEIKAPWDLPNMTCVTLQYTKTTDSPLPSDVKFAGLLSDGTVVYKKTVSTGGSVPSGATLIYRLPLLNSTDIVYYILAS